MHNVFSLSRAKKNKGNSGATYKYLKLCSGTRQQTSQRFLSRASLHKDSTFRTDDCQMSIHSLRIFTASLRIRYKS